MQKKLVIINGVMGVGKTTVSKELYKKLENSFLLEGDSCWIMNPFIMNEENKNMVLDNIIYLLNNFLNNSTCKYVIFNWVIPTDEIMNNILSKLELQDTKIYKITLISEKHELVKRIGRDMKNGLRDKGNIERSLKRYHLYDKMNTLKIDTTNKRVAYIVEEILKTID